MNITYIISYNIDWIELNWNSIFQTPQQPWKTLQILVFFPHVFQTITNRPKPKQQAWGTTILLFSPTFFQPTNNPKQPNQTKPRDILHFFPDLFFKTNNSNQQQQRAEEQPFCYFPQHFFNQPTTQSNQTKPNQAKPSQAKPNQTSQQRHTPDCFFSWPFFQNKQQQSTATKSRGTTILPFSSTFFQPTNNPKQPNQTKPNQAKPNQTSQQRRTPIFFLTFFQNKQHQSTATKSRGRTILYFFAYMFSKNKQPPEQQQPTQPGCQTLYIFPLHIWDVILPIDELIFFKICYCNHQPAIDIPIFSQIFP